MADLLLKVGDQGLGKEADFRDGDIIVAYSPRTISRVHIDRLTHPPNGTVDADGLRNDPASLAVRLILATRVYTRISRTEYQLLDKNKPVGRRLRTETVPHLQAWLDEQTSHPRHRIFGPKGTEQWFQSPWLDDAVSLSQAWDAIEANRPVVRADFEKFPFARREKEVHLPVSLTAVSRDEARGWEASSSSKKRSNYIDWKVDLGLTAKQIADVLDRNIQVDLRVPSRAKNLVNTR